MLLIDGKLLPIAVVCNLGFLPAFGSTSGTLGRPRLGGASIPNDKGTGLGRDLMAPTILVVRIDEMKLLLLRHGRRCHLPIGDGDRRGG